MAGDKNAPSSAPTAANRPRTEDNERRLRERELMYERPEHYALRLALGHDDLERDTPEVSNLAAIQPYKTGPENDPIRNHRKIPCPSPHAKTDLDDN